MQRIEQKSFLQTQELDRPSALRLFETAIRSTRMRSGQPLETHSYYPKHTKPYLHFTDFLHEQGDRPLTELATYAPFLSRLLSKKALDLVEYVPNTVDKDQTVWRWFLEKAQHLSLRDLTPFIQLIQNRIFQDPIDVWGLLHPQIEQSSVEDLLPYTDTLKHLVSGAGQLKPRKYPWDEPSDASVPLTAKELLFGDIETFFLERLSTLTMNQISQLSAVVECLLLYSDFTDERLANVLRAKLAAIPFEESAAHWRIIDGLRMPCAVEEQEHEHGDHLGSNWQWFVQQSAQSHLSKLEAWIPYLAKQNDSDAVALWFAEKAKDATTEQLLPWAPVLELFERSSKTQGQGIQFFMKRISHLPLEQLSGCKILFDNMWRKEDVPSVYLWLRSRIFTDSGVKREHLAEWQDTFARLAWKAEPELLTQMVSDVSEHTETIEEWRAIHEWVEALVHNLYKANNHDGSQNLPGNETQGRKGFLFLWENFTRAVGDNPGNAHEFGSLLWSFYSSQSRYWYDRELTAQGWKRPEDFENLEYWMREQLSGETQLHQVETWQHLLARNDSFYHQQIIDMFGWSSLQEVIEWRSYIQSAVQTLMRGESYNSTTSRIELLVQFSEEVTQHSGANAEADFSDLYVRFRDYVMSLTHAEASMLRSMARTKGVLNHTMMSVLDGKPFALELAKTGGRLFVWSEGASTHGATITNMVTQTAYNAWREAHDLNVPVTPILDARRIEETLAVPELFHDTVLVDTRAVGTQVASLPYELKKKLEDEIARQQAKIRSALKKHDIRYTNERMKGHDRDHNYLVEFVDREYFKVHGGWKVVNTMPYSRYAYTTDFSIFDTVDVYDPKTSPWIVVVRLTDWDHAFLKQDEGNVDTRFEPNHSGEGFGRMIG
jgi:hypothetical protein